MTNHGDITIALAAAKTDPAKAGELIDLVYDQLRAIAQARMNNERPEHTLQATALVNEACVRLLGSTEQTFEDRAHFFRAAAEAMRRVLVDHARMRNAEKRGGPDSRGRKLPLSVVDLATDADPAEVLAIDETLAALEREDPQAGEVVRLRFFAGLPVAEVARVMGISERTVAREWAFARARLAELLGRPDPQPE